METTSAANTFLSPEVLIAALIGFVLGAIIFYLLGRKNAEPADNPLQKPYDELQAEYKNYREKINTHFSKTATAVDNLTKSYQEVFDHLSEGAQQLMEGEALKIERAKRQGKAVTLAYLSNIEARQSSIPSPSNAQESIENKAENKNEHKADTKTETNVRVAPRPAEAAKPAAQPKNDKVAKTEPAISPLPKAQINEGETAEKTVVEKPVPAAPAAPIQVAEKPVAPANEAVQAAVSAEVKNNQTVAATAKEPGMPIEKPAAHISEKESAQALDKAKAAAPEPASESAEKTFAQKAAENAGLTAVKPQDNVDPLAEVKRHIRENQDNK